MEDRLTDLAWHFIRDDRTLRDGTTAAGAAAGAAAWVAAGVTAEAAARAEQNVELDRRLMLLAPPA